MLVWELLEAAAELADVEAVLVSFSRHSQFLADGLQLQREPSLSSHVPLPAMTFVVALSGQFVPRVIHMPSGRPLERGYALLGQRRAHLDGHAHYCGIRSFLCRANSFPAMMLGCHHCGGVNRPCSSAGIWEGKIAETRTEEGERKWWG